MSSNRHIANSIALTLALGLGACASRPALDAHTADFGAATAQNIAAQRVAPTAKQKADTFIPPNRARQVLARETYEAGETPNPVRAGTTQK